MFAVFEFIELKLLTELTVSTLLDLVSSSIVLVHPDENVTQPALQ